MPGRLPCKLRNDRPLHADTCSLISTPTPSSSPLEAPVTHPSFRFPPVCTPPDFLLCRFASTPAAHSTCNPPPLTPSLGPHHTRASRAALRPGPRSLTGLSKPGARPYGHVAPSARPRLERLSSGHHLTTWSRPHGSSRPTWGPAPTRTKHGHVPAARSPQDLPRATFLTRTHPTSTPSPRPGLPFGPPVHPAQAPRSPLATHSTTLRSTEASTLYSCLCQIRAS